MGRSMGLRDSKWSGMFKSRTQGVEVYTLSEGGLGCFERVMSRAFPGGLG